METTEHWLQPQRIPRLAANEVHVWRARVETARATLETGCWMLAPDEVARAGRFRRADDRARFLLARCILRTLLGAYLCIRPDQLRLRPGATGKPKLESEGSGCALGFNVSHAGDWVCVAAARAREVGIDVECWRDDLDFDALAARYFAPAEVAALRRLPEPMRRRAFFDCWTRKEAFVKAIGRGLSAPLDQFEVSLGPEQPAALLRVSWDRHEETRWTLRNLAVGPGYSAALSFAGNAAPLRYWEWAEGLVDAGAAR